MYESGQSENEKKRGKPEKNHLAHHKQNWLVSHVSRAALEPSLDRTLRLHGKRGNEISALFTTFQPMQLLCIRIFCNVIRKIQITNKNLTRNNYIFGYKECINILC